MSRDNNNSERPKRPRISTKKNSDDSRASRSGNSSESKPFKKSFPKAGEKIQTQGKVVAPKLPGPNG
jgi:23S rRNA pseudouridine2605 synthase